MPFGSPSEDKQRVWRILLRLHTGLLLQRAAIRSIMVDILHYKEQERTSIGTTINDNLFLHAALNRSGRHNIRHLQTTRDALLTPTE